MKRITLTGADPRVWGEQHGEALKREIHELYEVRRELMLAKTDLGDEETLLALAHKHLPVLHDFDHALMDELAGIGRGAAISKEKLVVLNHYTDMRDLSRRHLSSHDEGGCSVIYAPTSAGPLLGQTWDTHASATPYVLLLEVPGSEGATLLFTVAGCLGMTGMTSYGLAIAINNLNSVDAQVGVVWSALVRRALKQRTAPGARDVVLGAPLGSGHHYLVADRGHAFGIETSGTRKKITQAGADRVHLHTNHCLDAEMAATARVLPTSTTRERLEKMEELTAAHAPASAEEMYALLGEVAAQPKPGGAPSDVATCGAIVMDLARARALACQGAPGSVDEATVVALDGAARAR